MKIHNTPPPFFLNNPLFHQPLPFQKLKSTLCKGVGLGVRREVPTMCLVFKIIITTSCFVSLLSLEVTPFLTYQGKGHIK